MQRLDPIDETECVHLDINDDVLRHSKIMAYNVGMMVTNDTYKGEKEVPVNPKNFPTKAIDIFIPLSQTDEAQYIEIFFDPRIMQWNSDIKFNGTVGKLSPDQFEQFFCSEFYRDLIRKCYESWPLKDKLYCRLFNGLCAKEMCVGGTEKLFEEDPDSSDSDKEKPTHTASGRKIVSFSNNQVSKRGSKFYCWPNIKDDKLYRWSTWKDYTKIKPLCKLRFKHGEIFYGITINVYNDDTDLRDRGFRCYSLEEPPVQWLSKEECESLMSLEVIDKFIHFCASKLRKYSSMSPEKIYENINNPDKITIEEIRTTQKAIKKTCNSIVKNKQLESYIWR